MRIRRAKASGQKALFSPSWMSWVQSPLWPRRALPTEGEVWHRRPAAADLASGWGSAGGAETAGKLPGLQDQQP